MFTKLTSHQSALSSVDVAELSGDNRLGSGSHEPEVELAGGWGAGVCCSPAVPNTSSICFYLAAPFGNRLLKMAKESSAFWYGPCCTSSGGNSSLQARLKPSAFFFFLDWNFKTSIEKILNSWLITSLDKSVSVISRPWCAFQSEFSHFPVCVLYFNMLVCFVLFFPSRVQM